MPLLDLLVQSSRTVYEVTTGLAPEAGAFFLLSILLNRRHLIEVLRGCLPANLKVNYLTFLMDALLIAPALAVVVALMDSTYAGLQWYLVSPAVFNSLPSWAVVLAALFVGDLVGYFRHRLEHHRVLWPAHSMHHSDRDLTWFSLYRFHPLNRFTTVMIDSSMLLAVGFPAWVLLANLVVRHYYGLLIHANLPWTYGPLGRVFVSPAMHRWHHVREGQGIGKNFATVFSCFDQAFGTYYVPGPCFEPLGTACTGHASFVTQLINPICQWMDMRKSGGPPYSTEPTSPSA